MSSNYPITDKKKLLETGRELCSLVGAASLDLQVPHAQNIDLQTALQIARFHNILPIAYYALSQAGCTGELMAQAEKSAGNMAFKQIKLGMMEERISRELSSYGIPHYILKGSQLQKNYSEKTVRTSTDTDFYLDEKHLEQIGKIMERLGFYFNSYNEQSKTYVFKKEPRYNVEIHCMLEDTKKDSELSFLETLLENPVQLEGCRLGFRDENLYLHTFFHLYKHFSHLGAGLKMFLDIYVLSRRLKLDFERINSRLGAVELDRFHDIVLRECGVLFGGCEGDEITDRMTEKIFFDGAFGVKGGGNERNNIVLSDNPGKTKRRLIIQNMGADRDTMRRKYPVLEKAPYLLPFCHVHRTVRGMITKPEIARSVWKNIRSMSRKKLKNQEEMLTEFGLKSDPDRRRTNNK